PRCQKGRRLRSRQRGREVTPRTDGAKGDARYPVRSCTACARRSDLLTNYAASRHALHCSAALPDRTEACVIHISSRSMCHIYAAWRRGDMADVAMIRRRDLVWGAMVALAASILPAAAQDSEQAFFTGKTLRLIVGFAPGGGYDLYARMLAPYLSKNLSATVIVENRPGAGGLVALNGIYVSPPDGLTLMIVNGTGAAFSQLTDQHGARYDLSKFGYSRP